MSVQTRWLRAICVALPVLAGPAARAEPATPEQPASEKSALSRAAPEVLDPITFTRDIREVRSSLSTAGIPAYIARARQIQAKWADGDPVLFARIVEAASANIHSTTFDHAFLEAARGFAESGLAKADALPLELQAKLVLDLTSCSFRDFKGADERGRSGALTKDVETFVAMWKRVRTAIDPNYTFAPSSVMAPTPTGTLPDGSKIAYTGMPPEMIPDPAERTLYVAGLDARTNAYRTRDTQNELRRLDRSFALFARHDLVGPLTKPSKSMGPLGAAIAQYMTDANLRADILVLASAPAQQQ